MDAKAQMDKRIDLDDVLAALDRTQVALESALDEVAQLRGQVGRLSLKIGEHVDVDPQKLPG